MNTNKSSVMSGNGNAQSGRVAVAYVADRNYHDMTLYALASVAITHHKPVDIFFFQNGYSAEVPAQYRASIEARGHRLVVDKAPQYEPANTISISQHLTSTTYLRVAVIEQLACDYAYVLYLDGDTLAFDDLRCDELAGFSESAAACLDLSVSTGFDDPSFAHNCRRNGVSSDYFNAGVIMINSKRWLATQALSRFTCNLYHHQTCCDYLAQCSLNDQCVMNLTFANDYKILPVTYNVQKSALQTRAWSSALMRHYTGRIKFMPVRPWRCDQREHELLRRICAETGLPSPPGFFDRGLGYLLNTFRRRRTVGRYEGAIREIESRIARNSTAGEADGAGQWH